MKLEITYLFNGKEFSEVHESPKLGWASEAGMFRIWYEKITIIIPVASIKRVVIENVSKNA